MVRVCVFASCPSTSRKSDSIGFARFVPPSFDEKRAALWVRKVSRPDFGTKNITRFTYVCERHFHPDTFDYDYRSNLQLTPFEEGTVLTKLSCDSSPAKIQPVWKTYQKKNSKSTAVKYFPLYHDIRDNDAKIDLEGKVTFLKKV